MVLDHVKGGRLRRVMDDWCDVYAGYYADYASRRQSSSPICLVIDALHASR